MLSWWLGDTRRGAFKNWNSLCKEKRWRIKCLDKIIPSDRSFLTCRRLIWFWVSILIFESKISFGLFRHLRAHLWSSRIVASNPTHYRHHGLASKTRFSPSILFWWMLSSRIKVPWDASKTFQRDFQSLDVNWTKREQAFKRLPAISIPNLKRIHKQAMVGLTPRRYLERCQTEIVHIGRNEILRFIIAARLDEERGYRWFKRGRSRQIK